ncbi:MAG: phospholipase D-like domain-containing protein [Myxococcota bacterium]
MIRTLLPLLLAVLSACGLPAADAELFELDPSLSAEELELRRRDFCTMTGQRAAPLDVFVQPEVGEEPYLRVIAGATRSLRIMVYEFNSDVIREAVRAKAASGLDVRVILDRTQVGDNQETFDVLTAAGAKVQWSDPRFTYTHAKFIVADEKVALISTGNLDHFMRSGRNFGAIDRDLGDVRTLVRVFEADFAKQDPVIGCTRLLVAPINAKERHLELINGATRTLEIESMQFSDREIRDAVYARHQAGVQVRVLLASPTWIDANDYAGNWLKDRGIPARWRRSPAVHVKTIIADGQRAFLGSENLSYNSLTQNREVGLVTTEPDDLSVLSGTVEQDWTTATDF